MWFRHLQKSLQLRLLALTGLGVVMALALAANVLSGLFRDHVRAQLLASMNAQLAQLTAAVDASPSGAPVLLPRLVDPGWDRPYSGAYWQLDEAGNPGKLRSRSLWDFTLALPADVLADGEWHQHFISGPAGQSLLVVERTVRLGSLNAQPWRLMVARDMASSELAEAVFSGALRRYLGILGCLLMLVAVVQVLVGLRPLRVLRDSVLRVRQGEQARISGDFPSELLPLVEGFNRVLDRNDEVISRARTQAGNLAHAIKTPLSVMANAASSNDPELAHVVSEQIAMARRQVDWHMSRSRAAAGAACPGVSVSVNDVLSSLLRVMEKVHAEKNLMVSCDVHGESLRFAGEEQDLQEIVGNVLDNACKWARQRVQVDARQEAGELRIDVEDDGPGLGAEQASAVFERGWRLDEQVAGYGLGLAIVSELVGLYNGRIEISASAGPGTRVTLWLPSMKAT